MSQAKLFEKLPVIDAKIPVKISIMSRDINTASIKNPADCVAARACRREFHSPEVRVHLSRVYVKAPKGDHWTRYETGAAIRGEIISFDRGGGFSPGEYVLGTVRPSRRLGEAKGSATSKTRSRNLKKKTRRPRHIVMDVRGGPASSP